MKNKYIEIVSYATGNTVKRILMTSKSDRIINKIQNGLNINLNHHEFFTRTVDSKIELETGDFE